MGHPLLDVTDKTAVVIGGTSGIGLTLARGLAVAGANVIPTGRRSELARKASDEIVALGRKSLPVTCDVTSKENLKALLDAVCGSFGSVQILVNCAGQTKRTPTLDLCDAEWNAILETNLTGTLRAMQVFGRHMIEQRYGRIINIGSLSSFLGLYEVAAYGASKAGVLSLTKSVASRMGSTWSLRQCPGAGRISHRVECIVARWDSSRAGVFAADANGAVRSTRGTRGRCSISRF